MLTEQENGRILSLSSLLHGFLSGALIVLSFPSHSYWPIIFVALVPFFRGVQQARNKMQALQVGWSACFWMSVLGFSWVSDVAVNFGGLPPWLGKAVLFGYSIIGEPQLILFAMSSFFFFSFFQRIQKNFYSKILFFLFPPTSYVALDWLLPKLFPSTLGHCLYGWFELSQIAEWTGVFGLTFLVLVSNLVIFNLLQRFYSWRTQIAVGSLTVFLFITLHFWGNGRISFLKEKEKSALEHRSIALIQANIGDIEKIASESGFEPAAQQVLNTYRTLSAQAVKEKKVDLLIWPETAYPFLFTNFESIALNLDGQARDAWIRETVEGLKTALYFGGYSTESSQDFNSAFLIQYPYEMLYRYRKSILLPFGEYLPLGPLSPYFLKLFPIIANFGRGNGPDVFEFKQVKFAPQICYEGIFPEFSRQSVRLGADVLLNITNDSWFGKTDEPALHLLLTVFRSIELRRPLIRATNTGYTVYLDWTGKVIQKSALFAPSILHLDVPYLQDLPRTLYLRVGEWWIAVLLILTAILSVYAGRKTKKII